MFQDTPMYFDGQQPDSINYALPPNGGSNRHSLGTTTVPSEHTRNLYVSSLPNDFTTPELFQLFSSFGPVVSARFMPPKSGGGSENTSGRGHNQTSGTLEKDTGAAAGDAAFRGFGFVCYQRGEDAHRAMLSMIGAVVRGSKIQVRPSRRHSDGAHIGPQGDNAISDDLHPQHSRQVLPSVASIGVHHNGQPLQHQQFQPMMMMVGQSTPPSYAAFGQGPSIATFPSAPFTSQTFAPTSDFRPNNPQDRAPTQQQQHPLSGSAHLGNSQHTTTSSASFAPNKLLGTSALGASQLGTSAQSLGLSWQSLGEQQQDANESGSWAAARATPPSTPASSPSWLIAADTRTDAHRGLQHTPAGGHPQHLQYSSPTNQGQGTPQPLYYTGGGPAMHNFNSPSIVFLPEGGHQAQHQQYGLQQQQQQPQYYVLAPSVQQQAAPTFPPGGGSGGQFAHSPPNAMFYALPQSTGGGGLPNGGTPMPLMAHPGGGNALGVPPANATSTQQVYVLLSPPPQTAS